jgi:hypothetical protein
LTIADCGLEEDEKQRGFHLSFNPQSAFRIPHSQAFRIPKSAIL